MYGDAGEASAEGGRLFTMSKTAVRVMTQSTAADVFQGLWPPSDEPPLKIASLRILVRDASALRAHLKEQNVAYRETADGLLTPADEGCGVVLEFTQASVL